ncbi:Phosphoserine phosphatase [Smittium culicis]|uniref:phosphoserine phosphatase n=1 Tax=Smittium culicis TaxID=133412 RepID=A0A1R1XCH0_9FUNG|nr:Phosphoserine phosphatase [Smittium culicis]
MKFEEYYLEQLSNFPTNSVENAISYTKLRAYLEANIKPYSVDLSQSYPKAHIFKWESNNYVEENSEVSDFKSIIGSRLQTLSNQVPGFISILDQEAEKFSNFVKAISAYNLSETTTVIGIVNEKKSADGNIDSSHLTILTDILENAEILEDYIFLNFAAIVKILKRFDKHSGIKIRDPYIMRFTNLLEVVNTNIASIKITISNYLGTVPIFQKFEASNGDNLIGDKQTSATSADVSPSGENETGNTSTQPNLSLSTAALTGEDRPSLLNRISGLIKKKRSFNDSDQKLNRIAISLRGPHGTDIIGGLLECCANHNSSVLDFSFSRLHHNVVFGALVEVSGSVADLFNSLVKTARKWDGILTFDVQNTKLLAKQISGNSDHRLSEAPYSDRLKYVATVLNQNGLSSLFLDKLVKFFLARRISVEQMKRLDLSDFLNSVEFTISIPSDIDTSELRKEVFMLSTQYTTDIALQQDNVFRRQKRLVVFDMDSTLIQQEVIDEIARHAGVVDQVSEITELAMMGMIDFKESLKRRVGLLANTPAQVLDTVQKGLVFTDGAHSLCRALKNAGFKLAVISGGFIKLATYVKNELGLDYAFANSLETDASGKLLTGKTYGPIVDAERKAELLDVIAQAEGIAIDQVVAVGDGANDLKMLARASLGIAFNAKPKVQEAASIRINQKSLVNVLYLMGYSEKEALELQRI